MIRLLGLANACIALLALCACASSQSSMAPATHSTEPSFARDASPRLVAKTSIISFPVTAGERTWSTAGILNVPYSDTPGPRPAVVIVHGSGGIDSRGALYAETLNRAGFVTLEIDLWAPRGVRSAADRPRAVSETLPDAFAALAFLSAQSADVDPRRIGITGFSWGGVVSMLTATAPNRTRFATGDQRFAAHAPIYPVCWVYNHAPGYEFADLTGAPVFIQAGDADTYDAPESCTALRASLSPAAQALVSVRMHANATHAWERREPDAVITDPYSHQGQGGEVPLRYNEQAARESTRAVVEFFQRTLYDTSPAP